MIYRRCCPKVRLLWDRKHEAVNDSDKRAVVMEVSFRGKRKWVALPVRVCRKQWDEKKQRVVKCEDAVLWNSLLGKTVSDCEELFAECERMGRELELWMVDELVGEKKSAEVVVGADDVDKWAGKSLVGWIESRIKERKDLKEGTLKTHKVMLGILDQYNKSERLYRILKFGDLTKKNVMRFDDWLHRQERYQQTSIYGIHKRLKRYVNEAKMMGMIKESPYATVKIKRGKSEGVRYLTEAEFARLRGLVFTSDYLRKVRDLFLFQCYTGLAYADMARFRVENCEERDGRLWLRDTRVKSDEVYEVLILKQAREVLDRWNGKLPMMSNTKYNEMLKVIQERADIRVKLTSHVGRHTFAVLALKNGVPIETLAKMMGHTDIKTTQIYAKVLGESVEEGFRMLEGKM